MARERGDGGTRQAILDAAGGLFQRLGYSGTSMQQIADEVGILKGSMYHHYGSKQEILYALTRESFASTVDEIGKIALHSEEEPPAKLRSCIRSHVRAFADNHPGLAIITAEQDDNLPAGMHDDIMSLRYRYQHLWEQVVEEGQQVGAFRADASPTIVVNFLLGALNWMYRWYQPEGRLAPEVVADIIANIFVEGLVARD